MVALFNASLQLVHHLDRCERIVLKMLRQQIHLADRSEV
jgi:hypothetical protein